MKGNVGVLAAVAGLIGDVDRVIDELDDVWASCKEAGVNIADALAALEQGDSVDEVVAVVRELGKRRKQNRELPGANQGHRAAFRFFRAKRRELIGSHGDPFIEGMRGLVNDAIELLREPPPSSDPFPAEPPPTA